MVFSEVTYAETNVGGKCCACKYTGDEETECPARDDKTHCECWYDGPDELKDPAIDDV